ncbi:MAG: pseudouridine synthase [Bdellovibrionales bacterium]
MSSKVRLNKYISQSGIASRRKADEMIEEGQVMVNGRRVYELGIQIDPAVDRINIKGKPIKPQSQHVYVIFNKPKNVLTSMSDPMDRPNLGEYFKKFPMRVFPVGRLDWDSEGMLLMTNDGDFAQAVAHPKGDIPKTYIVKVNGHPSQNQIQKLLNGVSTAVGRVKAVGIRRLRKGAEKYDWLQISITEGRNRQIRRMFEKIGFDVLKLQRISVGSLSMGGLKRGEYKVIPYIMAKKALQAPKLKED